MSRQEDDDSQLQLAVQLSAAKHETKSCKPLPAVSFSGSLSVQRAKGTTLQSIGYVGPAIELQTACQMAIAHCRH